MQRVLNYTNKNPWLWGVYVVVIGLPIVLIFSFCCNSQVGVVRAVRAQPARSVCSGSNFFFLAAKRSSSLDERLAGT